MLAISLSPGDPDHVKLVELPRPQLQQPTDAIVMVTTTVIGHWELDAVKNSASATTPGAQFAGVIVETGEAVSQLNIDDLVIATCAVTHDSRTEWFGDGSLAGGHAEYVRVPNADITLVKTTAAAEERSVFAGGEAALGVRAANEAVAMAVDAPIVVMGCDASALSAIAWVRHKRGRKAQIFAVENNPARLAAAKSLGATELEFDDFAEAGADVVVAGMSVQSVPQQVPVFWTAGATGEDNKWPTHDEVRRAEMAVRLRQIDLTPLVSTVLPLDEAVEAYRVAVEMAPGVRSVLLKP